jgi:hypothetical protein
VKKPAYIIAASGAALALATGLAVGQLGVLGAVGLAGMGIAVAAFVDLRITLLAIVPAMVLLPELPLSIPLRTEDLLMVPLAGAWLARLALGRERWPSSPLNRPLAALVLVELTALLWGAYRGTAGLSPALYSSSFFFLKTVEVVLLYLIVISTLRTKRDLWLFTYVFCASATVVGVWGILERGTLAAEESITGPAGQGGYSLLGLTLVVLLAVLVSLFLTQRSRAMRVLLALAAAPVVYSLLFTFSRQAYVGSAAAIATLAWVRNRRLIIPALLLALALPFVVPEVVEERAASIVTRTDPKSGADPYATRLHAVQRLAPEVLLDRPFLGYGPAAVPPGYLDNQYLLTLYYTGLIGLGVFIWLLWTALRTAYASYHSLSGSSRGLALAWLAATVGLSLAGLAGSPFVAVRVRQVYWFLAALTIAATKIASGTGSEADDGSAAEATS